MIELPINEQNFLLIAMHHYDNSQCTTIAEFEEDLKKFSYLKKLFARYKDNGELKERLILNHIIVLYNLFGITTTELLFFKIDKQYWDVLATFLIYLERLPTSIPEFGVVSADLNIDQHILSVLRKI
jgi:hypothetical protein